MALVFQCKTLRGNRADDMIENSSLSLFSPRWGMNRKPQFLAVVTGDEKLVAVVNIAVTPHGPALRVAEGDPEMEVVLVKEYMTGVGEKDGPALR